MKQIELLKKVFKERPHIQEQLNELEEEIDRLKKENEELTSNDYFIRLRNELDEILECNQRQANRIHKAIEYINKEFAWSHNTIEMANKEIELHLDCLVNILQGSDEPIEVVPSKVDTSIKIGDITYIGIGGD